MYEIEVIGGEGMVGVKDVLSYFGDVWVSIPPPLLSPLSIPSPVGQYFSNCISATCPLFPLSNLPA
jgi:hypothetical protein